VQRNGRGADAARVEIAGLADPVEVGEHEADVGDADRVRPVARPVGLRVQLQDATGAVVDGDRVARMVDPDDDVAMAGQVGGLRGVERGRGAAAVREQDHEVLPAGGRGLVGGRARNAVEGPGHQAVATLEEGLLGRRQHVGRAGACRPRRVPDA